MIFPTFRYHRTKEPVIVNSPAELKALGEGWVDNPGVFEADPSPETEPESDSDKEPADDESQGDEQPELHQLTPQQKAAATRAAKKAAAAAEKTNE